MNPDRDDPLLDACLDEILGGRRPPDLTTRILDAWSARHHEQGAPGQFLPSVLPGSQDSVPEPPPVLLEVQRAVDIPSPNGRPLVELGAIPSGAHRLRGNSRATWMPLVATIAACAA